MFGKKDKKEKSKKGKGGKVNQPEEIPAEHSNGVEIQEGGREKSQEKGKMPRTELEKTNEPQPDEPLPEADEELEGPLPDIEPCQKRRKVTIPFSDEQELDLVGWYRTLGIFYLSVSKEIEAQGQEG